MCIRTYSLDYQKVVRDFHALFRFSNFRSSREGSPESSSFMVTVIASGPDVMRSVQIFQVFTGETVIVTTRNVETVEYFCFRF